MMRALLLCLATVPALAQTVVTTVPTAAAVNIDRPWAGGIGRYQQWFSAPSLQAGIPQPMRIEQIEFFAGLSSSAIATTINCEILMGHGLASGVTGQFATNFASPPVMVLPLQNVALAAGAPGAVVMTIPFTTKFTWDRVRPLVLEIRIHGNGQNNQPFVYNHRGVSAAGGATTRVYQAGSVTATLGTVSPGVGLIVRFTARPGVLLDYGSGCPGGLNVTPVNSVQQLMEPGINWTHQVSNAGSSQIALWTMGDTPLDGFAPNPPALDLSLLFGVPQSNCFLRNNALWLQAATTVGGGPGSGIASFTWALPAVTSYVGLSFYTQWIVFDPLSPNGLLSTTQGIRCICAPVGG